MARMQFRPTLWATLAAIPALAMLLGLGTWQLQRLAWKEGLIAERGARIGAPPLALDLAGLAALAPGADVEFRRVRVTGTFDHGREMFMEGRVRAHRPGVGLIVPLVGPGGATVLVDRGYLPAGARDPAARPDSRPAGPGDGRWRAAAVRPARPVHARQRRRRQHLVLVRARRHGGGGGTGRHRAVLHPGRPGSGRAGAAGRPPRRAPTCPNPHLGYAITWYGIAAALVAVYLAFHLRRRRADGDD